MSYFVIKPYYFLYTDDIYFSKIRNSLCLFIFPGFKLDSKHYVDCLFEAMVVLELATVSDSPSSMNPSVKPPE